MPRKKKKNAYLIPVMLLISLVIVAYALILYSRTTVYVDPVPPSGGYFVVLTHADSYVMSLNPNNNYGDNQYLIASGDPSATEHFFIKINTTDYGSISSESITDATLFVRERTDASVGLWGYLECRNVTDNAWEELEITWNNMPEAGDVLDSEPRVFANYWIEFNVTSWVKTVGLGGNISFRCNTQPGTTGTIACSSRDHVQTQFTPYLNVTYGTEGVEGYSYYTWTSFSAIAKSMAGSVAYFFVLGMSFWGLSQSKTKSVPALIVINAFLGVCTAEFVSFLYTQNIIIPAYLTHWGFGLLEFQTIIVIGFTLLGMFMGLYRRK